MFECRGCFENCHVTNIPWWGNACMVGRVREGCFDEIKEYKPHIPKRD